MRRLLRALGWVILLVASILTALLGLRYALLGPEQLFPDAALDEVPGLRASFVHFRDLLRHHLPLFAAHFVGGPLALLVGPWQLLPRLRARRPGLHRALGYVYAAAVLTGGTAALGLAPRSHGGLVTHVGFAMLGALWILSTGVAVAAARAGDLARHRAWMLRSFALTLAAVTLRAQLPLWQSLGYSFDEAYQTVGWSSWVPNLVLVELLFVRAPPREEAAHAGRRKMIG